MAKKSAGPPAAALCGAGAVALAGVMAWVGQSAQAQEVSCALTDRPKVKVVVEGVRSERGEVVVELYPNDPKRFLAYQGRVDRLRLRAQKPVTSACINAPSSGMYALVLYHDENNDEVFNRSKIGLPSEGFGFSNNARPMLGPPPLKSVLFEVPEGESTIRVRMRYLITDRG